MGQVTDRRPGSGAHGVEFQQGGIGVRVVVPAVPLRGRVQVRKVEVEHDALVRIGIHGTELGDDVDHRSGARPTCQTAEHVEGHIGRAAPPLLHVLHDLGDALAEPPRAHGEQEAAEPSLLPACRVDVQAGQDLAPCLTVADPGLQVRVGVQVVDDGEQIGLGDQHLAALRELDRATENGPRRVAVHEGFGVGVHEQMVDDDPVRFPIPERAEHGFPEGAQHLTASAAEADHQVIHRAPSDTEIERGIA